MAARAPFVPSCAAPARPTRRALWLAFRGDQMLVRAGEADVPTGPDPGRLGLPAEPGLFLGELEGRDAYAVRLDAEDPVPEGLEPLGLRALYGVLDDPLYVLAGRAFQLLEWERTHRFCGHCATRMHLVDGERATRCPSCGLLSFPRLSPAVIMLVRRGDHVLLARGRRFAEPIYSALAGFVEPGESLEEAVAREVHEEVGLEVVDVRYFGSQPWPYPHSLMIGFMATALPGELFVDPEEITDARWFGPDDELPRLPGKLSIARRLLDAFLEETGRDR